ncbi:aldolase [Sphingosinicella rhizophila]|uniref:Aldolase n=1 Tax=Sphingosinicella rhizophila TaxID=3050082 RepID=A0ABU3QAG8_9SPHN|nr:aldolase [Sphingosinicella sp. GR2756]MDT9600361.1 aldolase [Sphingosinicella sp. GR2756]
MDQDKPAMFAEDEQAAMRRVEERLEDLSGSSGLGLVQRIALGCRFLARQGHGGNLAGQITARAEEAGTYWTTDWGRGFADACVSGVVRIDREMNVVEGEGKPNPAIRFHLWIYETRPQTAAIVHTHPPFASALGMTSEPFVVAHMDSAMFWDDCARLDHWPGLPLANEEGRIISEALGDKRSILLAHHGLLTAGSTFDEALYLACLLERACQMQIRARTLGAIRPIDPALAAEARDFLLKPKLVSGTVDYWLRQIVRTDGDALQ